MNHEQTQQDEQARRYEVGDAIAFTADGESFSGTVKKMALLVPWRSSGYEGFLREYEVELDVKRPWTKGTATLQQAFPDQPYVTYLEVKRDFERSRRCG